MPQERSHRHLTTISQLQRSSPMRRRLANRTARVLTSLAVFIVVAACGGGGISDTPVTELPPPDLPAVVTPVTTPTAAFTAAATATVQAPIAFDASASKAADGGALQYVWDFGDGVRGGGAKIAHAFAAAGARSVTLTVIDASGRQGQVTRGVDVTAAAAAVGNVLVQAAIYDASGIALPGVVIGVPGRSTPVGTTDGLGRVDITLDRGPMQVLRLTKAGYTDQTKVFRLPTTAGTGIRITAVMRPRDAAQSLTDAHAGGSLVGRAGATITLPVDALVNSAGVLVSGAVPISMTAVDPTLSGGGGFPGRFDGITADGETTPIVSFGTVEFVLGEDGNRLQLAPGKAATIELPLMATRKLDGSAVAVGDVIPLWSLDETSGAWIQEGTGTVVANAAAPFGLALRALVSHFSWWNADQGFEPYEPNPECPADFDGLPESEKQKWYSGNGHCFDNVPRDQIPVNRSRAAAATAITPRIAGYSRSVIVPITGGVATQVPPSTNVYFTAFALNGTWSGRLVVHGAAGTQGKVSIAMRPVTTAGSTVEAITLPVVNLARSIPAGRTSARFSFTVGEAQAVHFRVGAAPGALLSGAVRMLQGTTVLATGSFDRATAADLLVTAAVAGTYVLEVTPDQPGAISITGELLGGVLGEPIGFPATLTRTVPAFTTYNGSFDLAATTTVHLAFKLDFNSGNPRGELRLIGPNGVIFLARKNVGSSNGETADLSLPPGHYTFTYLRSDDRASSFQFSTEAIDWLPVADGIPVADSNAVTELVADRNGRPVLGVLTHPVINQIGSSQIQLKRFTGTGWEDVGGPLASSPMTCGYDTTSIAFDSTNTPTIAYTARAPGDVYSSSVRRLVGGVWQAVGPNNGALPGSGEACDDTRSPRLVIDSADRPIVAYKGNATILVRRFDGTDWSKLAATAQDSFPVNYSAHDLAIDPAGILWFALRGGDFTDNTVVRRFDVASGLWQTVGPNAGVLPEANTSGFSLLRFGFDATGRPVIGGAISVFSPDRSSTSGGTAVYRFDGTNWLTTGGYQLPSSMINNSVMPGFAVLGNDVLMSWTNAYPSSRVGVVERNTRLGWSGYGIGTNGQLAAYVPHGPTPERIIGDSRVLVVGSDVYLAVDVPVLSSSVNFDPFNPTFGIVLLKKTP
jgi:hypothetical protein